jgi:hypothetical protein
MEDGWVRVSGVRIKNGQLQLRNPTTYYGKTRADKASFLQELFGTKTIRYKKDLQSTSKKPVKSANYKLLVDVTGRGNWVEQASGSEKSMKSVGAKVRAKEGMNWKVVPV